MTNATTARGTPSSSIFSIARGNAASELAVLNAIVAGSATASIKRRNGTFIKVRGVAPVPQGAMVLAGGQLLKVTV